MKKINSVITDFAIPIQLRPMNVGYRLEKVFELGFDQTTYFPWKYTAKLNIEFHFFLYMLLQKPRNIVLVYFYVNDFDFRIKL